VRIKIGDGVDITVQEDKITFMDPIMYSYRDTDGDGYPGGTGNDEFQESCKKFILFKWIEHKRKMKFDKDNIVLNHLDLVRICKDYRISPLYPFLVVRGDNMGHTA
jgi:hypothetical protein